MSTIHERTVIGYTLVDITETKVIRDVVSLELERNQQRNWETVIQSIGLRAQPQNIALRTDEVPLENYEFGELYKGTHRVWSFAFTTDYPGVFDDGKDPIGLLESDFNEVPVVTYLSETARFLLPLFYTAGPIKNIYFKIPDSGVNT
jgi:hypothetical protein